MEQVYSTPHREVSKCTMILQSNTAKDPGNHKQFTLEFDKKYQNAKDNFKSDTVIDPYLKVNDCRSLVRDNIALIRSLMEEYHESIPIAKQLAKDGRIPFTLNLLTGGDVTRLMKRFNTFSASCKSVEPGVNSDYDETLYDSPSFKNLLQTCSGLDDIAFKDAINNNN